MTVSAEGLNKDFVLGILSSSIVVKLTSASKNIISDYVRVIPVGDEILFVQYLLNNFDTDGDVAVELSELEKATEFNVSGMNISSLYGVLENMPNLEKLDCSENNLKQLYLNNNAKLLQLFCNDNCIDALDCSYNGQLQIIDFSNNADSVDVKQAGLLICGTRWSIYNLGADKTNGIGNNARKIWLDSDHHESKCIDDCPQGWRLPTKAEMTSLISNSKKGSLRGIAGWWFSGDKPIPSNYENPAVFFRGTYNDGELSIYNSYYPTSGYGPITTGSSYKYSTCLYIGTSSVNISNEGISILDSGVRCVKDE